MTSRSAINCMYNFGNCLILITLLCTGRCAVIGCKLKQNANEGCYSCASLAKLVLSFIACLILFVIAPLPCSQLGSMAHLGVMVRASDL